MSFDSISKTWQTMDENGYFEYGKGYWIHSLTQHVWKLKGDSEPKIRSSIPAYFSPGPLWDTAVSDAPATEIMIMNPLDGPGSSFDAGYASAVSDAQSAEVKVIGYVYTLYGSRDPATVKAEIDDYMSWYDVDGIFLDEVSDDPADLPYYQDLENFIRTKSGSFIMINPGAVPDEQYMGVADVVAVFEGNHSKYLNTTFPAWLDSYPKDRFQHFVYDTPFVNFRDTWSYAESQNVGYIYITDDVLPNPWNSLPDYWSSEVDASNSS
jgi:hypothetical protein